VSPSSNPIPILVFGRDAFLLDTRAMVLENAGFNVIKTNGVADAEAILETQDVALVVLCHTLSGENREAVVKHANSLKPVVKTLLLTASAPVRLEAAPTAILSAFDGPETLVETVDNLMRG